MLRSNTYTKEDYLKEARLLLDFAVNNLKQTEIELEQLKVIARINNKPIAADPNAAAVYARFARYKGYVHNCEDTIKRCENGGDIFKLNMPSFRHGKEEISKLAKRRRYFQRTRKEEFRPKQYFFVNEIRIVDGIEMISIKKYGGFFTTRRPKHGINNLTPIEDFSCPLNELNHKIYRFNHTKKVIINDETSQFAKYSDLDK